MKRFFSCVMLFSLFALGNAQSDANAVKELRTAVERNLKGCQEENMELVLMDIDEPNKPATRQVMQALFDRYDLSYRLLHFKVISCTRTTAVVEIQQETRKIRGPEFVDTVCTVRHTLKRRPSGWKLCASTMVSAKKLPPPPHVSEPGSAVKAEPGGIIADDEPVKVFRAFFHAYAKGDIDAADNFIDPANNSNAQLWYTGILNRYTRIWIGPKAYIRGGLAYVDFSLGDRRSFEDRREVLIVKKGGRWQIRFGMATYNGAHVIPGEIKDFNTKHGMRYGRSIAIPHGGRKVNSGTPYFREEYTVEFR